MEVYSTSRSYSCMTIRETFARNLKTMRNARGLSQEELAHLAKLDRTYISSLERCVYSPTIDVVDQIAHVLGTTVPEMLT